MQGYVFHWCRNMVCEYDPGFERPIIETVRCKAVSSTKHRRRWHQTTHVANNYKSPNRSFNERCSMFFFNERCSMFFRLK